MNDSINRKSINSYDNWLIISAIFSSFSTVRRTEYLLGVGLLAAQIEIFEGIFILGTVLNHILMAQMSVAKNTVSGFLNV